MLHTQYHVCVTYPAKEFKFSNFALSIFLRITFFGIIKKKFFFQVRMTRLFFFHEKCLHTYPFFLSFILYYIFALFDLVFCIIKMPFKVTGVIGKLLGLTVGCCMFFFTTSTTLVACEIKGPQ
jgi:hypothetical protein